MKLHAAFLQGLIGLQEVTAFASGNRIVESGLSSFRARNNMIYRQILFLESLAAVCANVLVASKKRFAGILYVSYRQTIIPSQYDDFGDANLVFNGGNRGVEIVLRLVGKIKPRLKLIRNEIRIQRPRGVLINQGHRLLKVNKM